MGSHESSTDFKWAIARVKGNEQRTFEYIAEFESCPARSDELFLALCETIDKLERDADERRAEVETLQQRLDNVLEDGDGWRVSFIDSALSLSGWYCSKTRDVTRRGRPHCLP